MLIGLATLFTILFFGGVNEAFLIDKLEKGVKQSVTEKERKKEILADLKVSKKYISAFNKSRKASSVVFKEMNASYDTDKSDLTNFFNSLMSERITFQNQVIGDRVRVLEKITEEEWASIFEKAEISVQKRLEKLESKESKGKTKEPFAKTREVIITTITDEERADKVLKSLAKLVEIQKETFLQLQKLNAKENEVLADKFSGKAQLKELGNELNEVREKLFNSLIDFHFSAKEYASLGEWDPVMKSFNKEVVITPH